MIITTARRVPIGAIDRAKQLAKDYKGHYVTRRDLSIDDLKALHQEDVVIVTRNQIEVAPLNQTERVFFHPNLSMIRAKRFLKGEEDPLISTAGLKEGDSFLDCTLGLASDSIVASLAVGASGSVKGIEGNPLLYLLVKEGLAFFVSGLEPFNRAMRRIQVLPFDHNDFLNQAETNSYDVVYFDPMFHVRIDTSNGLNAIRREALVTELSEALIQEAKRVARRRVVLKDHWKSERFEKLSFTQHKRKTSLFHYGTLEVDQ